MKRMMIVYIGLCCFYSLYANEDIRCKLLGAIDIKCKVVENYGSHILIGAGSNLTILEFSDTCRAKRIASITLPDQVEGIKVQGHYAYVAAFGAGLRIIDLIDPLNPREIGHFDTDGLAYDMALQDTLAYIADGYRGGLVILNIKNPAHPIKIGEFDTPGSALDVALHENYAYVADDQEGIQILDTSDPKKIQQIGHLPVEYSAKKVIYLDNILYLLDPLNGIIIFDTNNPASPEYISNYRVIEKVNTFAIKGKIAYVVETRPYGLYVLDLHNPQRPAVLGSVEIPGNGIDMSVNEDNIFIADEWYGLHKIKMKNPKDIQIFETYQIPGFGKNFVIHDGLLYLAAHQAGVYVYDIHSPTKQELLTIYDIPGIATNIHIHENLAIVADQSQGFFLFDINNPLYPQQIGKFIRSRGSDDVYEFAVRDSILYVTINTRGLVAFDVHDQKNLKILGMQEIPISLGNFILHDSLALVASGRMGLYSVNVNDPKNMSIISSYDMEPVEDIAIKENLIFTVSFNSGMRILDINDPFTLKEVGKYDQIKKAFRIKLNNNIAIVITLDNNGIFLIDISNPGNPQIITSCDVANSCYDIEIFNGMMFISTSSMGLLVYRIDHITDIAVQTQSPISFSLEQNYPNPYNSTTTIRYTLNQSQKVRLSVFDILGRPVEYLVDEFQSKGTYEILYENRTLGSGIYFYEMRTPVKVLRKKMLLIK
ncbi:T9SS type A sorting domain-containing protein [candidate division KSB1 bacterium]|nr:T9SS type A sorting domain-containing protein [candidate division KSB1 bacterium]